MFYLQNVAIDESVIEQFMKGARVPNSVEPNAMQTRPETLVENASTAGNVDNPFRGEEMCSSDLCKAKR